MLIPFYNSRDVKTPYKAHPTDAGFDFFIPNDFEPYILMSGSSIKIPSGIHVEIPCGYVGMFTNKSGVASKFNLLVGADTVDHRYDGEVHIDIHNVGNDAVELKPGMKIIQLLLVPVLMGGEFTLVDQEELYAEWKDVQHRGANGFGSTGI